MLTAWCCGWREQKEARRFLGALAKRCQLAGSNLVTTAQLYALSDDLDLTVPDTGAFIGELNEAGAVTLSAMPCVFEILCIFCVRRVGRIKAAVFLQHKEAAWTRSHADSVQVSCCLYGGQGTSAWC